MSLKKLKINEKFYQSNTMKKEIDEWITISSNDVVDQVIFNEWYELSR